MAACAAMIAGFMLTLRQIGILSAVSHIINWRSYCTSPITPKL